MCDVDPILIMNDNWPGCKCNIDFSNEKKFDELTGSWLGDSGMSHSYGRVQMLSPACLCLEIAEKILTDPLWSFISQSLGCLSSYALSVFFDLYIGNDMQIIWEMSFPS